VGGRVRGCRLSPPAQRGPLRPAALVRSVRSGAFRTRVPGVRVCDPGFPGASADESWPTERDVPTTRPPGAFYAWPRCLERFPQAIGCWYERGTAAAFPPKSPSIYCPSLVAGPRPVQSIRKNGAAAATSYFKRTHHPARRRAPMLRRCAAATLMSAACKPRHGCPYLYAGAGDDWRCWRAPRPGLATRSYESPSPSQPQPKPQETASKLAQIPSTLESTRVIFSPCSVRTRRQDHGHRIVPRWSTIPIGVVRCSGTTSIGARSGEVLHRPVRSKNPFNMSRPAHTIGVNPAGFYL